MNGTKSFYQSKALWGSVVTIAATGAGMAGLVISPEVQDQAINLIVLFATGIGGVVSLIGRIKADTKIAKKST
jgi:hypothetical protein